MFGTATHPFTGHFEGNGQTLNVALNGTMHVSPFAYTNGATIQDLTVAGTINATQYAGGIVGHAAGTLSVERCVCSATISSFQNYAGGLLGWCDDLTLNFQNCLFKGSFSPGSGGKYHPIALKNAGATIKAPAAVGIYYLNTFAPSEELGDHVIKRAEGLPVSTELVDGVWDDPVTAIDGRTYYAAHFNGQRLPYEYGFENYNLSAEGWTMVDCFDYYQVEKTGIYWSQTSSHGGNCYFYFNNRPKSPQYLVSPEFSGHTPILVRFYMNGYENFACQLGYSTTTPDIDAFTWGGINTPSIIKVWELYEESFPKGTKYIAVKWLPGQGRLADISLDDFSFTASDTPSPVNLSAIDVTEYTAAPSWEAPPAPDHPITGYAYQFKKASDADWPAEVIVPPTTTSAAFDGLSANMDYQFRVKALYGEHGESIYTLLNFTTAMELPYEIGFENGMNRWRMVDPSSNSGIKTEAAYNGKNCFKFDSWDKVQCLISPRFAGTSEMTVSFYYNKQGASTLPPRFQVGYSTTTSDPSAFMWETEIKATGWWTSYERTFPTDTRFIAVRLNSVNIPTDQPNHYIASDNLFIDDFSFVEYSEYAKPTGLAVSDLTDQSAKFTWTAPDASVTEYAYQYKKPTDDAWSTEATAKTTSVTIDGLEANTTYNFRMKALYNGGNASNYVTARFFTEGPAVTSLPFNEGFENGMGGWRASGLSSEIISNESDYIHDGNCSFKLAQHETLISPRFEVSTPMLVSFYYKNLKKAVPMTILPASKWATPRRPKTSMIFFGAIKCTPTRNGKNPHSIVRRAPNMFPSNGRMVI
ncbi:MAG: fibronectin type III domain-containing protein [Prevotella sp.]|nr:fibronectin type III domain-containing protein [Prevotella sp.]